jgi:hypothetical protein
MPLLGAQPDNFAQSSSIMNRALILKLNSISRLLQPLEAHPNVPDGRTVRHQIHEKAKEILAEQHWVQHSKNDMLLYTIRWDGTNTDLHSEISNILQKVKDWANEVYPNFGNRFPGFQAALVKPISAKGLEIDISNLFNNSDNDE